MEFPGFSGQYLNPEEGLTMSTKERARGDGIAADARPLVLRILHGTQQWPPRQLVARTSCPSVMSLSVLALRLAAAFRSGWAMADAD